MLTCHAAYGFASKELPTKFGRLELELIKGFTPLKVTDDQASWSAVLMNYYFCLGMVALNPAIAICHMEEAGVTDDAIECALIKNKATSVGRFDFKIYDTLIPVAPPTFSNDPALWLERGFEVKADLKAGDVCVFNGLVGFHARFDEKALHVAAGFVYGSVGVGEAEQTLIKVVRV